MHYTTRTFANSDLPTMVWRDDPNQRLGGRVLSTEDINQINRFYNCPQAITTTTTTTTAATTTATTTTPTTAATTATTTASTPSIQTTSTTTTSPTRTASATSTDESNTSASTVIPNQGIITCFFLFIISCFFYSSYNKIVVMKALQYHLLQ